MRIIRTIVLTCLASFIAFSSAVPAHADVLCKRRQGIVVVREECRDSETLIDPVALGLQGPQGPSTVPCLTQVGNEAVFEGCNVRIANGTGDTSTTNGLGNLVIGYNEDDFSFDRSGSHNLVIGRAHTYSSYSGIVGGIQNTISGPGSVVITGSFNRAGGGYTAILNGANNDTTYNNPGFATIVGGESNIAGWGLTTILGGYNNRAFAPYSSIIGSQNQQTYDAYETIPPIP